MLKDLKKAKDKVEYILETIPVTRDCDKTLWLVYLAAFHDLKKELGDEAYNKFKSILLDKDTCTMESIRRMRQKFQEEGKFQGTKRKAKMEEEKEVRGWIR